MSEVKESSTEVLKKFKEVRQEELKQYESELIEFLKERNIDISATITSSDQGNIVNVFIVDKLS